MSESISISAIAHATHAPLANVLRYWPEVYAALDAEGISDRLVQVGAAATIGTEVWSFKPVTEKADGSQYEGRADLGNTEAGDGPRFRGRGFIQLTGRANYHAYGQRLGVDLCSNPERALEPETASKIFALYFQDRGVAAACRASDWRKVRRLVNGGYNGFTRFIGIVQELLR
jgi:hypothetical protein